MTVHRSSFLPPLWVISLLLVAFLIWILFALKELVALLVIGYSIAYILEPALHWGEKRQISRPVGLVVVGTLAVLVLLILGMTTLPTLSREFTTLMENLPSFLERAKEVVFPYFESTLSRLPENLFSIEGIREVTKNLPAESSAVAQNVMAGIAQTLMKGYSITLTILNLFLLPFIVFYLAVDFRSIHYRVLSLFPYLKRERVKSIASEIDHYVSAYVRGQLTVGAILCVLYAVGLGILGVELWLVLAVISGFGNLIPYLGFLIGIFLSTVMALVTFGDFQHVLAVWAIYAVVQGLEGSFITPKIVGGKIGLHPLVVLLALVAGGSLFGILGIFLAVPVVAVVRVLASRGLDWAHSQ